MIKILVFGMGSYSGGGIVNYIMNQVRTFDKNKIHVDFIYHYNIGRIAFEDELNSNEEKGGNSAMCLRVISVCVQGKSRIVGKGERL